MPVINNNDILESIEDLKQFGLKKLKQFKVIYIDNESLGTFPELKSGGFAFVCHVEDSYTKTQYALRVWHTKPDNDDFMERSKILSNYISKYNSTTYIVNYEYLQNSLIVANSKQDVLLMDWIAGKTLFKFLNDICETNSQNARNQIRQIARRFKDMAKWMHSKQIAHGDLQHDNIIIKDNGDIVLCDYDSMYVPGMENFDQITTGYEGYQHPLRKQYSPRKMDKKDDYFSEIIIYLGLLILSMSTIFWDHEESNEQYFIFDIKELDKIKHDIPFQKLSDIFTLKCKDKEDDFVMSEIRQLLKLLRDNLNCSSLDSIKPIPGLDSFYCCQCSAELFPVYQFCPYCGSRIKHSNL